MPAPFACLPLGLPATMRVAVFSSKPYDRRYLGGCAGGPATARLLRGQALLRPRPSGGRLRRRLRLRPRRNRRQGHARSSPRAACGFIALRAAGFNNVDLDVAKEVGIRVARVPAYSPYAVAEYAVALILALDRDGHIVPTTGCARATSRSTVCSATTSTAAAWAWWARAASGPSSLASWPASAAA